MTQNGYDLLSEPVTQLLPDGSLTESRSYDAAGNLTALRHFNGKTTTYTYDPLNRLIARVPDPSLGDPTVTFTYTPTGKRASMTDGTGTTSYTYDTLDRLVTKATPEGTLTYSYDAAGNVASMASSNANGASASYSYDALNRLSSVVDNRLPSGTNTTTYTYDNANNLVTATYPNGIASTFQYDALNRGTSLSSPVASYNYQFSPTGNRTSATEQSGRSLKWSYDNIYRLTNESISQDPAGVDGSVNYSLDPVGNRLSDTSTLHGVNSGLFSYNPDDWLMTETYDNNGNVVSSGAKTFTYDSENRLTSMNGGYVTLQYDGDGNRVSETVSGVTTRYLVDDLNPTGYAQVVEELSGGAVQREYTYGLQRISEDQLINKAWTPSFYNYDGGGTVRQLTSLAGSVTDTYAYDAFGNLLASTGATPNNYLYRGEQYDPSMGLYYLRARYYNPMSARFMSRDPDVGKPKAPRTLHKYIYASDDLIDRVDPAGRDDLVEFVGRINESIKAGVPYLNAVGCGIEIGSTLASVILKQSLEGFDWVGTAATFVGCVTTFYPTTWHGAAIVTIGSDSLALGACAWSVKQAVKAEEEYIKDPSPVNSAELAADLVGAIGGCATGAFATSIDAINVGQ